MGRAKAKSDGGAARFSSSWATAEQVQAALARLADPTRVPGLMRFFKTGPGEYAEGDQFRGLKVPQVRAVVRQAEGLPLEAIERLVASPWHEDRLAGLLVVVRQFPRAAPQRRRELYAFYLAAAKAGRINNWDLVDVTAEQVVGGWLRERQDRAQVLDRLAGSSLLWERRIAVLASLHFIRCGEFADTLRLAARLREDAHDLMHKAVGWMLREVGKRDRVALDDFLTQHAARMPRTMLRYAIEKHAPAEREQWRALR
ncbi:MAG: DNA alkylation repair protein [Opitutaceae bacterium]|nr:DNA alkylation repair protein [Opitutaceae bacterium]